jgi:hypothetical protein
MRIDLQKCIKDTVEANATLKKRHTLFIKNTTLAKHKKSRYIKRGENGMIAFINSYSTVKPVVSKLQIYEYRKVFVQVIVQILLGISDIPHINKILKKHCITSSYISRAFSTLEPQDKWTKNSHTTDYFIIYNPEKQYKQIVQYILICWKHLNKINSNILLQRRYNIFLHCVVIVNYMRNGRINKTGQVIIPQIPLCSMAGDIEETVHKNWDEINLPAYTYKQLSQNLKISHQYIGDYPPFLIL